MNTPKKENVMTDFGHGDENYGQFRPLAMDIFHYNRLLCVGDVPAFVFRFDLIPIVRLYCPDSGGGGGGGGGGNSTVS